MEIDKVQVVYLWWQLGVFVFVLVIFFWICMELFFDMFGVIFYVGMLFDLFWYVGDMLFVIGWIVSGVFMWYGWWCIGYDVDVIE